MFDVLTLNKISHNGLKELGANYAVSDNCASPDGIIVRSAAMHDYAFSDKTVAVARAGAGVNNIPVDACTQKGVVVFNTPGANANAVKELVICALLMASRKVASSLDWCKTLKGEGENVGKLVEKGKSAFAGPEIMGKTLGVVGLGAIGTLVAEAAETLGMKVIGYDPYLSDKVKAKLPDNVVYASSPEELYASADYITLHLPCITSTRGMVNAEAITKMKDGARLLNFSRGELVVSTAIAEAVSSGKLAAYITDFPTDDLIGLENVTALPHLGASTPESEENCAYMAAVELRSFLENGTIKNSVNFPNTELDAKGERLAVIHQNTLNAVNDILGAFTSAGIETTGFVSKAKGDVAYTLIAAAKVTDDIAAKVSAADGVIRARAIR